MSMNYFFNKIPTLVRRYWSSGGKSSPSLTLPKESFWLTFCPLQPLLMKGHLWLLPSRKNEGDSLVISQPWSHTYSLPFLSSCWVYAHLQSSLVGTPALFLPRFGDSTPCGTPDKCPRTWMECTDLKVGSWFVFAFSFACLLKQWIACAGPIPIALYHLLLRAVATKCEKSKQSTLPSPQWSESTGAQIMLSYQKPRQVANRKGIDFS